MYAIAGMLTVFLIFELIILVVSIVKSNAPSTTTDAPTPDGE